MSNHHIIHDYIAGAIGGSAGLLIGHPLDTVKVQLQAKVGRDACRSTMAAIRYTSSMGASNGLFRGLTGPLVTYSMVNSVFFGVYGGVLEKLKRQATPTYGEIYMSGCLAGLTPVLVQCPVEVVKVLMQANLSSGESHFRSPTGCFRWLVNTRGWGSLYRGVTVLAARDLPTYGAYMAIYEWCLDNIADGRSTLTGGLIAGGVAGFISWSMAVPADVVKSRIQSRVTGAGVARLRAAGADYGLCHCVRSIYAEAGLAGFFTGWTITVCRSVPVNAITLVVYSYSLKRLRGE